MSRAALLAGTALCAPWAAAVALAVPTLFLQIQPTFAATDGQPGTNGTGGTGGSPVVGPEGVGGDGGDAASGDGGDGQDGELGSAAGSLGGGGGSLINYAGGGGPEAGGGAGYTDPTGSGLGGGGGGGGGGRGDTVTGGTISTDLTAGNGGDGAASGTNTLDGGGGGGGGGIGVVWTSTTALTVDADVTGGDGGDGGKSNGTDDEVAGGGTGGDGGYGIFFSGSSGTININATRSVTGGDGGTAGGGPNGGYDGLGGFGIVGANITVVNHGTVTGGDGAWRENVSINKQAEAIDFTSGTNSLSGDGTIDGGLRVEEDAVLNLSGSNSFTGGSVVVAGTLNLKSNGGAGGAGGQIRMIGPVGGVVHYDDGLTVATAIVLDPFTVTGTAQLSVDDGKSATQSGVISEGTSFDPPHVPQAIEKIGGGTLTLSGTNTYSGGTVITEGTLAISKDANLGDTDGGVVLNGGTLEATDSFSSDRDFTLAENSGIKVDDGETLTLNSDSGSIDGAGQLTKTGTGTLVLLGDNTYTGGTKISEGTVQVSADNNLGADAGDVTLNGGTLQAGASFTLSHAVVVDGSGTIDANGSDLVLDEAVSSAGSGDDLTVDDTDGGGSVTFGAGGDVSGTLTVAGGTAKVGNGTNASELTVADATVDNGAGLTVQGNGTFSSTGNLTNNGTVTIDADGTLNVGDTATNPDSIGGSEALFINNGTVTNNGTVNDDLVNTSSYTNNSLENADVLYNSGTITNSLGATWNGNIADGVVGTPPPGVGSGTGNQPTGVIQNDGTWNGDIGTTGGVGNLGEIDTTGTWNGLVVNSGEFNAEGAVNGNVENNTGGTFTLTGALDGFVLSPASGINTFLNDGTLDLNGNSLTIGSLSGTDGTANVTNGNATAATLTTGGNNTSTEYDGTIDDGTGAIALTKEGTGTFTLAGANTYSGDTNINAGIVKITGDGTLGDNTGDTTVADNAALQVDSLNATSDEDITITGDGPTGNGAIENVGGANTLSGQITLADDATIGSTSTTSGDSLTLTGGIVGVGSPTLTLTGAGDGTISTNGIAASVGALTKSGAGTWTLSANNAYTGDTTINAGTLALSGSGDISESATVNLTTSGADFDISQETTGASITNLEGVSGTTVHLGSKTLTITNGDSTTEYAGSIQDGGIGGGASGDLTIDGGTVTLSGDNSYTGTTTINAATLAIKGSGDIAQSAEVNVASADGTFDISQVTTGTSITTLNGVADSHVDLGSKTLTITNGSTTYAGIIEDGGIGGGAGGKLTVSGGSQELSGDSTFTGAMSVTGGTLTLDATGSTTTNTVDVSGTGHLVVANNTDANGALSNTAVVTLSNTGEFEVQADETIGHLSGSGGTELNLSSAVATLFTGGDNASSQFDGTITGAGGLNKQGTGNFTLTGNSSGYTGATHIAGGTLTLTGASASLGSSDVTIDSGTIFDVSGASSATVGDIHNDGTLNMQGGGFTTFVATGAYDNPAGGGGTINLDISLDHTVTDTDTINVASFGGPDTTEINFSTSGTQQLWDGDKIVVHTTGGVAAGSYHVDASDFPSGLFAYTVADNGTDIFVHQTANLGALGGLASNITLVQSIIGAVVNRPSSPFVGGLAASVPAGYCGAGPWVRGTGGFANADGSVTAGDGAFSGSSNVDLNYVGAQFGLDLSCFNVQGVDVAYGIIGGYNAGTTSQQIDGPAPSTTDATFTQEFGGIYATVNKDNFSADIQAREDITDFAFTNASLGLDNSPVHTDRLSVSGSASYSLPAGDFRVVPTAGFSVARNDSSAVNFATGEKLAPDTSFNYVGFAGVTLSKPTVLPDKLHAIIPFGTITAYNDFAPDPTSVFTDATGGTLQLVSSNLGFYTEVSAGLSFVSLLDDSKGGPKQFNASVRADARFSDQMQGFGVTAQARAQF